MPELYFVLPHWLYWAGLVIFPIVAIALVRWSERSDQTGRSNLGIGYLCLVTAGFVGMHRYYARNMLGFLYLIPFFAILYCNSAGREARVALSNIRNEIQARQFEVKHFSKRVEDGFDDKAKVDSAQTALSAAHEAISSASVSAQWFQDVAFWLFIAIIVGLSIDALLLPRLIGRLKAHEKPSTPEEEYGEAGEKSARGTRFRPFMLLGKWSGEFVAYWSVIAVFVYYYEVVARYVFNSPTNWAHEAMFLMFGMQYLICGAYAYLFDSHVRVDILYASLSRRGKAITNLATSFFFFVFAGTLLVTGWIFSLDSMQNLEGPISSWEVSFTEWAIQYWPVKVTIVLGAVLLLLQGIAKMIEDVAMILYPPADAKEDTAVGA